LREIAEETVNLDTLRNSVVQGLQKHVEVDEPEEDEIDVLATRDLALDTGAGALDEDLIEDGLTIQDDAADIENEPGSFDEE
jgi:DNA-directed RNA polymerase subunit omega